MAKHINVFSKILLFSIVAILIYLFFTPVYCYTQLKALNTNPYVNRDIIMFGIIVYILLFDYRILSILPITSFYRVEIGGYRSLRELLLKDIKYSILPIAIITVLLMAGYIVVLYSSRIVDPRLYVNYSAVATIMLGITSIYVMVFAIPYTISKEVRRSFIIGLSSSLMSSITSLAFIVLSSYIPVFIWRCSAEMYNIVVVNPNTRIVELTASINAVRVVADIVGYTLYAYILYILSHRRG